MEESGGGHFRHPLSNNPSSDPKNTLFWPQDRDAYSADNMLHELSFYTDLANAKNINDFKKRILSKLNSMGFSDFAFGPLDANGGTTGGLATTRDDILRSYQEEAFYECDLVLQHARKENTPIYTSTIEKYLADAPFGNELFSRNFDIIKLSKCYGYQDTYNIPFNAAVGNGKAVFSVLTKGVTRAEFRTNIEYHRADLNIMAHAVDHIATIKFRSHFFLENKKTNIIISPKPLQLLNILAKENVTLKEAAATMCISLNTANKHAATIKKAFGANTQAAAVYSAIKKGLIDLND